jgi:hypothetical protein
VNSPGDADGGWTIQDRQLPTVPAYRDTRPSQEAWRSEQSPRGP